MSDPTRERHDAEDPATGYLSGLEEKTMRRAWGSGKSYEYRRRVVSAAIIFGRQLEERMSERPPEPGGTGLQRFLMELINAAISEFARSEGTDEEAAAEFLSDVETRDYVLEFNEVLDEYLAGPDRTLDELLREAVENRRERAISAQRWISD